MHSLFVSQNNCERRTEAQTRIRNSIFRSNASVSQANRQITFGIRYAIGSKYRRWCFIRKHCLKDACSAMQMSPLTEARCLRYPSYLITYTTAKIKNRVVRSRQ
ncbi:hypothetical protein Y032_0324g2521 [Ancylostoma ceylanicum]|uniref:Uncharacterized protein n=1 Tax=Ancylostoma ceylanicum TaxID=53326 RepID=A0A016S0J6_9BILA|nr:hypothetical protein Y032_0324g2521 [Ancylostoma ceylanicum]